MASHFFSSILQFLELFDSEKTQELRQVKIVFLCNSNMSSFYEI
jgi:hypothetical protein